MDNFADRLIAEIQAKGTPACIGIDPRLELLPMPLRRKFEGKGGSLRSLVGALKAFSLEVIDVVAPHVPVVKPQVAFFEMYGWVGIQAYIEVVRYARKAGLIVIGDVKRSDVGSTAEAYASGHLGQVLLSGRPTEIWHEDAVTLNPYLGADSIEPFLREVDTRGKGVFVLVRTSNPSAAEIQNTESAAGPLYMRVADLVARWGRDSIGKRGFSSVGAVVGATAPGEASSIRAVLPQSIFLVPGYGAQGGGAADVRPCFRSDRLGAIVNSSRAVIFAYRRKPYDEQFGDRRWQQAVLAAVKEMRRDLDAALGEAPR